MEVSEMGEQWSPITAPAQQAEIPMMSSSLEAGKIADMVLLDRNPYDIPKEELASVKVKQLYLRGQEYKKGNGGGAAQILRGMIKRGKC